MRALKPKLQRVTALAPASSANLGVGFDILGLALDAVADRVTLTKRNDGQLLITKINSVTDLPLETAKNTASYALHKMCADLEVKCGFSIVLDKGIAIGSGMGGSAASAVAAVVALNEFLECPLAKPDLIKYALYGEEIAAGGQHADNVAPCIYGGITLIRSIKPVDVINLPYPNLYCVIIHPHLQIETKSARQILNPQVPLQQYIAQSAQLAATICALYQKDLELLRRSMQDIIIEPQRAGLIAGYYSVKQAALSDGAIAAVISGSGPSLLAICASQASAEAVNLAMLAEFKQYNITADSWISPINPHGAYVVNTE